VSTPVAATLRVRGGGPLHGAVRVPGDKSISHRALLLAALAEGRSSVTGLSDGDDVARTAHAVGALGAMVDAGGVAGGASLLHAPSAAVDAGNSGTTMRLFAGLVAGWPWRVEITGDASLSARPMDRVAAPLRAMGATVSGRGERTLPPITVAGGDLHAIDYSPPMASAQVKSCVLLAGLRAAGTTVVREAVPTRPHTEELLALAGADIEVADEAGARVVRLRASSLSPFELEVPGDPSQAAFWAVAGTVVPGSELTVEGVYVGPGRRGFLDVLGRMGAHIEERPAKTEGGRSGDTTMPVADLLVHGAPLVATVVEAAEITGLDEVPILAVAASVAKGTTVFRDVGELRVKESDRLAGVVYLVTAFGGRAEAVGDDLHVAGAATLRAASLDAAGDHRMAMAAAVAALAVDPAGGDSAVSGFDAVATSYPAFVAHLHSLAGLGRAEVLS
jgi:3-phosphoshikimate 1-carboxyvinyltransferase